MKTNPISIPRRKHGCLSIKPFVLSLVFSTLAGGAHAGGEGLSAADIQRITQFKDADGRIFLPQGFVANTHVRGERLDYLPSDYQQMARYGANMQVVRIGLGRLGGWPGYSLEPGYFEQIDRMIDNAAAVGIRTGLKMVVYDIKNFRAGGWEALWENRHGEQEFLIKAWSRLWTRYKDNPNVFSYDLLNEPMQGRYEDPAELEREVLAPLYRKLIDALQLIDQEKWACYQPIHTEPKGEVFSPFAPWKTVLDRKHIIYAPHIYEVTLAEIPLRLDSYLHEAAISQAKLMLGEWGPPTYREWDHDREGQRLIEPIYETSCAEVDLRSIGTIKAWFTGTPHWVGSNTNATWSIFQDKQQFGTIERKYIMDRLCRPRPLSVAGELGPFGFDFATRIFTMQFTPLPLHTPTELYVPANRHYPDGFKLKIDGEAVFELQVDPSSPCGLKPTMIANPDQGIEIEWNPWSQRIAIFSEGLGVAVHHLEVSPGFTRPEQSLAEAM